MLDFLHDQYYQLGFLATVCMSLNKAIIGFGFWDILNNLGLGKCYQPRSLAQLITLTST